MNARLSLLLVAGGLLFGQAPTPAPESRPDRVGELERLGEGGRDLMVLGLEAPGFEKLKLSQRKFAYYMYRAAIAGNDIYYQQNHRFALEIRDLMETLLEQRAALDPAVAEGIEEYLKLVWANHGHYHHWNHAKFVPRKLSFVQLQKAVKAATKAGAKFAPRKGESAERMLARLKPHIFDPKVEPLQVVGGADPIKASASGLYDTGLTMKEIEALPKEVQGQINVRFALGKDKKGRKAAQPQVFMVKGTYGESLGNVVYWLKKAAGYVENERVEVEKDGVKKVRFEPIAVQKQALDTLIAFLESGEEAKFKEHSIAWLKSKGSIDYLNGFYEVYKDPRSVIGAYQANVSFRVDSEKLDKLSQNALYFEAKMPWKDAWKRPKVESPVAIAVNVIVETGDGGPMSAAAYNLPNYDEIRRTHGSKNVMLQNVELARSPELQKKTTEAFYLPEDRELMNRLGSLGRQWLVYLHEVIGHGSGQADESLKGEEPAVKMGNVYNALEECRADAVALYQFQDPKLVEIGAVSAEDHAQAAKAMFLRVLGSQLAKNGEVEGEVIREAHERGEQLTLNWLTQPGKDYGVAVVQKDGHFYVQVNDVQKAKVGVGDLLEKLQTLKAMGDKAGAEALFEQFGSKVNPEWQKSAKARLEAIGRPKETALVFPQLIAVVEGKDGRENLKDVTLETKESFAEQMLRFKKMSRSRDLAVK